MCSLVSKVNTASYNQKISNRVNLKIPITRKKKNVYPSEMMDDKQTYCGDHFALYTYIKSSFVHLKLIKCF